MNLSNLIIINSPLENSPLEGLLRELIIINFCSIILLNILLTTFLQFLVVSRTLNLDFIDKLYYLKGLRGPLKRIIFKWQTFSTKSLLIYLFIWWLIILICACSTVENLQFMIDNLDLMINHYFELKRK